MKETILALALAGALMLAGCGGGSKTATMSGGPAVGGGGGGGGETPTPTPMPITGLPDNHTLTSRTIPAGGTMVIGRGSWVYISCPAGGADCVITVAADGTATSTGGTPTIMRSEDPDPTDTPGTPLFGLPDGHTLSSRTIAAGATVTIGTNASLSCPSGGEACVITVSDSGSARSTGGTPIVIVTIIITRPTPGDGTPGDGTTPITWEQLPSLVDRMDTWEGIGGHDFPGPDCNESLTGCQGMVKAVLAAATEPTGTTRRFQSTITVQLPGGGTDTQRFWGGWLDNSIYIVGAADVLRTEETTEGVRYWTPRATMGIRNRNPVIGVYRGDAVDRAGNWGTSELSYARRDTGGYFDLTINLPDLGDRALMRWSDISVDNNGGFDNNIESTVGGVGPSRLKGSFYQGDEVGGIFRYHWTERINDRATGAFGAKLTPDSP